MHLIPRYRQRGRSVPFELDVSQGPDAPRVPGRVQLPPQPGLGLHPTRGPADARQVPIRQGPLEQVAESALGLDERRVEHLGPVCVVPRTEGCVVERQPSGIGVVGPVEHRSTITGPVPAPGRAAPVDRHIEGTLAVDRCSWR